MKIKKKTTRQDHKETRKTSAREVQGGSYAHR